MISWLLNLTKVYHSFSLSCCVGGLELTEVYYQSDRNLCLDFYSLPMSCCCAVWLTTDSMSVNLCMNFLRILSGSELFAIISALGSASSSPCNIIYSTDCSLSFRLVLYQLISTDQMGTSGWSWADSSVLPIINTVFPSRTLLTVSMWAW